MEDEKDKTDGLRSGSGCGSGSGDGDAGVAKTLRQALQQQH
jgi:hypothetical protein